MITITVRKDKLPGGVGDDRTTQEFDPEQLRKGLEHELEHTDDPAIAVEIAIDHLTEDPFYYDHLDDMERSLNEITTDDVLKTTTPDSKKFFRKVKHMVLTGLEMKSGKPLDAPTPEQIDNLVKTWAINTFVEYLRDSIPADVTPAQEGASINWLKRHLLSNQEVFNRTVLAAGGSGIRANRFARLFEKFFMVQDFIEEPHSKDINTYADLWEIAKAVEDATVRYDAHQEKKKYLDAESGMQKIAETDKWTVVIPTNKGAACELGKGTSWCTAAPGLDYYEEYHKEDDPLFVFINKADPKERYQFHYGSGQFMDTDDMTVKGSLLIELHKILLGSGYPLPKEAQEMLSTNSDGTVSRKESHRMWGGGGQPYDRWTWVGVPEELLYDEPEENFLHRTDGPAFIVYDHWGLSTAVEDIYPTEWHWWYKGKNLGSLHVEPDHQWKHHPVARTEFFLREKGKSDIIYNLKYPSGIQELEYMVKNDTRAQEFISRMNKKVKELADSSKKINECKNKPQGITITIGSSTLISEIRAKEVLDGISADKKKFVRKFAHVFRTMYEMGDHPVTEPDVVANIFNDRMATFKMIVDFGTPRDVTDSQAGAAANWLKNWLLSDAVMLKYIFDARSITTQTDHIAGRLESFFKVQNFVEEPHSKDINSYKNINQIHDAIEAATPAFSAHQEKKKYLDAESGMQKIAETDKWTVVIPTNKGAACELGKGTHWCTAAPGLDYYEHYHKEDDPLFVFVRNDKPEERYQFHYGTQQFMDKHDEQLPRDEVAILHRILVDSGYPLPKTAQDMFIANEDGTLTFHNKQGMSRVFNQKEESWSWADAPDSVLYDNDPDDIFHRIDGPAKIIYNNWGNGQDDFYPRFKLWGYKGKTIGQVYIESDGSTVEFKFYEPDWSVDFDKPPSIVEKELVTDPDTNMVDTVEEFMKQVNQMPEYVSFVDRMEKKIKRLSSYNKINESKKITIKIGKRLNG